MPVSLVALNTNRFQEFRCPKLGYYTACFAYVLVSIGYSTVAPANEPVRNDEPHAPVVSPDHRKFLSRTAERTIRDASANRPMYAPTYVPEELNGFKAEVVVRLRHQGFMLAAGVGGPGPIAVATRDAALTAIKQVLNQNLHDRSRINQLLTEIEVVGVATSLQIDTDWTKPGALDAYIEPGIHGMVLSGPKGTKRFLPTELHTSDVRLSDALTRLAMQTHGSSGNLTEGTLLRFRTAHWYQTPGSAEIVSLVRGLSYVRAEAVNPERLDETIAKLAEYMAYRQRT